MKVQSISEMTYWSALALSRLGKRDEAGSLFNRILTHAQQLESETPVIDYFATSLPAMLLFDEDLKHQQAVMSRFLKAQAILGLGREQEGLDLLQEVLQMDSGHPGAIDLLQGKSR